MRTTFQISYEIKSIVANDRAYNNLVNEGEEGFEREDSRIAALNNEFLAAKAAEFAAEWTLETLAARRAEWNAEVAPLVAARKPVTAKAVNAIEAKLGYTMADIGRAKSLHGIA